MKSLEKDNENINLFEVKIEAIKKINRKLFSSWEVENDQSCLEFIQWLRNNPPLKSDEDVLGSIYIMCSPEAHRKKMGEHYTRNDLVRYIYKKNQELIGWDVADITVIDPACGSGNFVIEYMRLLNEKSGNGQLVIEKLKKKDIVGCDIQEVVCNICKCRILIELVRVSADFEPSLDIPIYQVNSLLDKMNILKPNRYDLVITNPPYLRYQCIDKNVRKKIAEKYASATGRYDLYSVFIEKLVQLARKNGVVTVVCSDKFMTAAYGKGIRSFIQKNARLLSVLDLSKIYPFQAAVLSDVYFFIKSRDVKKNALWERINIDNNKIVSKILGHVLTQEEQWCYSDEKSSEIIAKIHAVKSVKLKDVCRIFVGIKTTADSVFCHNMTNEFVEKNLLEAELVQPLLRGQNLYKWGYSWTGNRAKSDTNLLYPYKRAGEKVIPINLKDYPNARNYLEQFKEALARREYIVESNRPWYEIWVHQSYSTFEGLKIITPDIASKCLFSLDTENFFCNGTIYGIKWLENKGMDDYLYLLGVLNSRVIEYYHKKTNLKIRAQKYRFQTATMKNYPIVLLSQADGLFVRIVECVKRIIIEKNNDKILEIEDELNKNVYELYQLNIGEAREIENAINARSI